jgi:hypothetical protein
MVAASSENHKKSINTLFGHKAQLFIVKTGGILDLEG